MSKQCFPAGIPEVNHYTIVTSSESQRLTTMAVTHNGIPVTNYLTQVTNIGIPEIKYYTTETFCSNLHRDIRRQPLHQNNPHTHSRDQPLHHNNAHRDLRNQPLHHNNAQQ